MSRYATKPHDHKTLLATARWLLLLLGAALCLGPSRLQAETEIEGPASNLHEGNDELEGNDEVTDLPEEPLAPPPPKKSARKATLKGTLPRPDHAPPAPAAAAVAKKDGPAKAPNKGKGQAKAAKVPPAPKPNLRSADEDPVPEPAAAPGALDDTAPTEEKTTAQEVSGGIRVEDIVEPPSDYRFAAFGKLDPFLPPMVTKREAIVAAGTPPKPEVPGVVDSLEIPIISPLQRYALSELKVIGIWQLSTGERKAMIMTPAGNGGSAGQGIIVKLADAIGNRGGKIQTIGDDFLTIREFLLAPDGTRQYEDQQMYMGRRGLEDPSGKIRFTPGAGNTEVIIDGQDGDGDAGRAAPKGKKDALIGGEPAAADAGAGGAAGQTPNLTPGAVGGIPGAIAGLPLPAGQGQGQAPVVQQVQAAPAAEAKTTAFRQDPPPAAAQAAPAAQQQTPAAAPAGGAPAAPKRNVF